MEKDQDITITTNVRVKPLVSKLLLLLLLFFSRDAIIFMVHTFIYRDAYFRLRFNGAKVLIFQLAKTVRAGTVLPETTKRLLTVNGRMRIYVEYPIGYI